MNTRHFTDRKGAEDALQTLNTELERQVKERTSELEAANQELARSKLELGQFAYLASHDLQEPLRGVTDCVQLLEKRYQGKLDSGADQLITLAVDEAVRMKGLINDLLAYSRVSSRNKPFERADCAEILNQVRTKLQIAIEESGATVTHDSLPEVMADETQLIQLFQNLIRNAIKFRGDQSPEIHIGIERKDGEWLFWVQDNGIGVDPQYAERIFVIFQRLHTRREYSGTGVGLAICRKIVERHGGRIWVEPESGPGSTFYFTLPDGGGEPS